MYKNIFEMNKSSELKMVACLFQLNDTLKRKQMRTVLFIE